MTPYSQLRSTNRRPLDIASPSLMALFVEPTNACNFRCGFCPHSRDDYAEMQGGYKTMDMALYDWVLSGLEELGPVKVLRLYGTGEPLLHKDLPAMLKRVTGRHAARTEVTTNGTNLPRLLALLDTPLDYLRVSVYGTDQTEHRKFTGSNYQLSAVRENVRKLVEWRKGSTPFISVKMTDGLGDPEQLRRDWDFVDEVDASPVVHNWGSEWFGHSKRKACPSPFYTLFVRADGVVTCCCVDWTGATAVGDLRTETLAEVWRGERLAAFRRMHLEGRRGENSACRDCSFIDSFPDEVKA